MFHIHINITDPDVRMDYVKSLVNKELAPICVQVMKAYTNDYMDEDNYIFILRGVTRDNWNKVNQLVAKALRNVECKFVFKQPTLKKSTVRIPKI